jgi:hypothetical protein
MESYYKMKEIGRKLMKTKNNSLKKKKNRLNKIFLKLEPNERAKE